MTPRILDSRFKYTHSSEMDSNYLKRKFSQIRKEQREAERQRVEHLHTNILKMRVK